MWIIFQYWGGKKSQASAPLSLTPKVGPLALSCLQSSGGAGAAPVTTEALVITLPAPGYLTPNTECSGKVTPGQVSCLSGSLVSPPLLSWATCSPAQPLAVVPPGSRDAHRALGYGGAASRSQVKRMLCAYHLSVSLPASWSPAQGPAAHHLLEGAVQPFPPGRPAQGTGPTSAIP